MKNNFINLTFSKTNLDIYYIRNSIFNALKENINIFSGRLLDVGCGQMPYKKYILENSKINEYVGLDIETALLYDTLIQPDIRWDGITLPFENDKFDTILMTEVLEHTPFPNAILKEAFRVLKNEGIIFFTVPFLWPLHEVPNDEYRFTPFALERILKEAGFSDIKIKATGGWHASLAQMLGLWVRQSSMSKLKRKGISIILKPIIKFLIKKDKKPICFREGQMITGLYGIAKKL